MRLLAPLDAAAPPEDTWGPMLAVALVVVAIVAMIVGFGRISRRRGADGEEAGRGGGPERSSPAGGAPGGTSSTAGATTSDDELPTDPA